MPSQALFPSINRNRIDSKSANKRSTRCGSGGNATVNASQHNAGYMHVGAGQGRAGLAGAGQVQGRWVQGNSCREVGAGHCRQMRGSRCREGTG